MLDFPSLMTIGRKIALVESTKPKMVAVIKIDFTLFKKRLKIGAGCGILRVDAMGSFVIRVVGQPYWLMPVFILTEIGICVFKKCG